MTFRITECKLGATLEAALIAHGSLKTSLGRVSPGNKEFWGCEVLLIGATTVQKPNKDILGESVSGCFPLIDAAVVESQSMGGLHTPGGNFPKDT